MTRAATVLVLVLIALAETGCAGTAGPERKGTPVPDPVLTMLTKGILQLTVNIQGLSKRVAELQKMQDATDPTLGELRALDLSGWELHRQQWRLQRDHLQFAKDQLVRAQQSSGEKPQLLGQWVRHEQAYERALADLREQRQALERKRLKVEAQLIEQSLR